MGSAVFTGRVSDNAVVGVFHAVESSAVFARVLLLTKDDVIESLLMEGVVRTREIVCVCVAAVRAGIWQLAVAAGDGGSSH